MGLRFFYGRSLGALAIFICFCIDYYGIVD
uniref:Uncharacterized protein n=1 Tax=Rhizophora mucronata TaxID=61149 RepID=A0A2P2QV20_RHIMU